MNIVQYTKAASLEEAWELNQGRGAVVLGGCCWLRLSPQRRIAQAIDLSGLGLDAIEEQDKKIEEVRTLPLKLKPGVKPVLRAMEEET